MKRREVKEHHEDSVLNSFNDFLRGRGHSLEIIDKPDPPDATVLLDNESTWIEITDAFFSPEYARSLSSYVPDDVPHIPSGGEVVVDPDARFRDIAAHVTEKKYDKASILNVSKKLGAGILLVGLYSPFLDSCEIQKIQGELSDIKKGRDARFSSIYLYDQQHRFYRVE